jgi:phage tail tape-measure protein
MRKTNSCRWSENSQKARLKLQNKNTNEKREEQAIDFLIKFSQESTYALASHSDVQN